MMVPSDQLLMILNAYEAGVGKGREAFCKGVSTGNPYTDASDCAVAWGVGFDEGKDQARQEAEERAAQEPLPEASSTTRGICNDEHACGACWSGQGQCELRVPVAQEPVAPDMHAFFSALDKALALEHEVSPWSPKQQGSPAERAAAWAEVHRLRTVLESTGTHMLKTREYINGR